HHPDLDRREMVGPAVPSAPRRGASLHGRQGPVTEKRFVESADGTPIAYIRRGSGPALIQVDGALCYCEQGPSASLADQLEEQFTVYTDRKSTRLNSSHVKI